MEETGYGQERKSSLDDLPKKVLNKPPPEPLNFDDD